MDDRLRRIERYEALRARLAEAIRLMHFNKAEAVDLDSLEGAVGLIERVEAGQRVEVVSAQKAAAELRAVVKQVPPVSKPGRQRGWRPTGDREAAGDEG
ncbi:hypothetical protein GWK16_23865 [Roseomonas sp. JC162]|uniref:Uncharacterized protein n=1 Tax=Neoroseomonas marina TaxID=1232220 RepID=A0A848ELA9_9PROT|nr:hypothetical protein [Neoroseomonas marina]NMJ44305.1 hypothetical protein [Neoroseomonas marina]